MKFQTVKKGYDPSAVDEYINKLTNDDNNIIAEQKTVIEQLKADNDELRRRLDGYDRRKDEIFGAFVDAQEAAASLKRRADRNFEAEIERLTAFRDKWTRYAKEVVKTLAPAEAEKFRALSDKFAAILSRYAKSAGEALPRKTKDEDAQGFDPLKKVADILENFDNEDLSLSAAEAKHEEDKNAATGEEENFADISQAEIINVSESLEDLCKELGILDD